MTLYYTIWCLLTVCGGWFSVSIISCEGETKERRVFREDLKCILSISLENYKRVHELLNGIR